MSEDRTLQDWGGYEPETQKALRFVANLAGEGTAKQVAGAIVQEYAKREQPKPTQKKTGRKMSAAARHKAMTEEDIEMIVDTWIANHPHIAIDEQRRQFMIRTHLMMQKAMPGWTL